MEQRLLFQSRVVRSNLHITYGLPTKTGLPEQMAYCCILVTIFLHIIIRKFVSVNLGKVPHKDTEYTRT
jgi:hypothetical protein